MVQIQVIGTGTRFSLGTGRDETVADLKRHIQDAKGVCPHRQRLFATADGKERRLLRDDEVLEGHDTVALEYDLQGAGGVGFSLPCCGASCRCCEIQ